MHANIYYVQPEAYTQVIDKININMHFCFILLYISDKIYSIVAYLSKYVLSRTNVYLLIKYGCLSVFEEGILDLLQLRVKPN